MKKIDSIVINSTHIQSTYYPDMDSLKIGLKNASNESTETNEISCFRNMRLVSDQFGEPIGLDIDGVKENYWHMNRDLLKLAVIMHLDVNEPEAHRFVDDLYAKAKF